LMRHTRYETADVVVLPGLPAPPGRRRRAPEQRAPAGGDVEGEGTAVGGGAAGRAAGGRGGGGAGGGGARREEGGAGAPRPRGAAVCDVVLQLALGMGPAARPAVQPYGCIGSAELTKTAVAPVHREAAETCTQHASTATHPVILPEVHVAPTWRDARAADSAQLWPAEFQAQCRQAAVLFPAAAGT